VSCTGWVKIDGSGGTQVAPGAKTLFEYDDNVSVPTIRRFTGEGCIGSACPGWVTLDARVGGWLGIDANTKTVFRLGFDTSIWQSTGRPCSGLCLGWQELDNNSLTIGIRAGGSSLYQQRNDGSIWRYTGVPCTGSVCPGWVALDNNPKSNFVEASATTVYQTHDDGSIWVSTGAPCGPTSCPGWIELDRNPNTTQIAISNGT
jgi:hypothetical protein